MTKLYSFDLFDTLVCRRVQHPQDVFLCIEATGKVCYRSFFFKLIPFRKLRVLSEKIVRKFSKKEDINIYQIYKLIGVFLKNASEILDLEISIEYKILYPIDKNIELINTYIEQGERVCITSDMYLPKKIILEILSQNNINVKDVYVSSEIGLTKGSGNLFKYIAKNKNVEFENIIHYGDNRISDVEVPRKLGIHAIHVGDAEGSKSTNILNVLKSREEHALSQVGFTLAGPLSYAFSYYINKNNFNKNIVFGARDSYIFKKAYDTFFNKDNVNKTFYTRVSRSLVYLPSVYFTKNLDYIFEGSLTCNDFFKRIGFLCPNRFDGLNLWSVKVEVEDYLKNEMNFFELLKENSSALREYLKANGFDNNVSFIDIGWRGSVQDSLISILDDVEVKGFYIGTIKYNDNKKGFIFQNKRPIKNYFHILQCISYFEFIFTEPERSLNRIDYFNNSFKYVFTGDEDKEQILLREYLKEGAWNFFEEFKKLDIEIEEKFLFKSINKLIKSHTMSIDEDVINVLKSCSHSAGFNGSLQSSLIAFDDYSLMSYLRAPWKAYFMHEIKKKSIFKYYVFLILFHNFIFFSFYENFKIVFRKLRATING